MTTLDQALDAVNQLPPEQQEMLAEILRSRQIAQRRREIAQDAREAIEAFRTGKLTPQSADEAIAELRQSLNEAADK